MERQSGYQAPESLSGKEMVPKKGLAASRFGNSVQLNEIAASTEYTTVSTLAIVRVYSTAALSDINFLALWTP